MRAGRCVAKCTPRCRRKISACYDWRPRPCTPSRCRSPHSALRSPRRCCAEGVAIGLTIGIAIASYTLVDKEGLRHASPFPYLELVLIPVAAVILPVFALRDGTARLRAQLSFRTLAAAAGSFGAYVLFLFALRLTAAPGVAAVRETSVVIATGMAALFLR